MKNKTVGLVIVGIALLIGFIVYSFNRALTTIVNTSCSHGTSCPMWGTIDFQTNVGIGLMGLVVLIGLYFIFFMKEHEEERKEFQRERPLKEIKKEDYTELMKEFNEEEKKVFEKILEARGTIFQSNIVEETGLDKVKVTRILDKLEGRGLVERKRRGMTNVVILKHQ